MSPNVHVLLRLRLGEVSCFLSAVLVKHFVMSPNSTEKQDWTSVLTKIQDQVKREEKLHSLLKRLLNSQRSNQKSVYFFNNISVDIKTQYMTEPPTFSKSSLNCASSKPLNSRVLCQSIVDGVNNGNVTETDGQLLLKLGKPSSSPFSKYKTQKWAVLRRSAQDAPTPFYFKLLDYAIKLGDKGLVSKLEELPFHDAENGLDSPQTGHVASKIVWNIEKPYLAMKWTERGSPQETSVKVSYKNTVRKLISVTISNIKGVGLTRLVLLGNFDNDESYIFARTGKLKDAALNWGYFLVATAFGAYCMYYRTQNSLPLPVMTTDTKTKLDSALSYWFMSCDHLDIPIDDVGLTGASTELAIGIARSMGYAIGTHHFRERYWSLFIFVQNVGMLAVKRSPWSIFNNQTNLETSVHVHNHTTYLCLSPANTARDNSEGNYIYILSHLEETPGRFFTGRGTHTQTYFYHFILKFFDEVSPESAKEIRHQEQQMLNGSHPDQTPQTRTPHHTGTAITHQHTLLHTSPAVAVDQSQEISIRPEFLPSESLTTHVPSSSDESTDEFVDAHMSHSEESPEKIKNQLLNDLCYKRKCHQNEQLSTCGTRLHLPRTPAEDSDLSYTCSAPSVHDVD